MLPHAGPSPSTIGLLKHTQLWHQTETSNDVTPHVATLSIREAPDRIDTNIASTGAVPPRTQTATLQFPTVTRSVPEPPFPEYWCSETIIANDESLASGAYPEPPAENRVPPTVLPKGSRVPEHATSEPSSQAPETRRSPEEQMRGTALEHQKISTWEDREKARRIGERWEMVRARAKRMQSSPSMTFPWQHDNDTRTETGGIDHGQ